MDDSPTPNERTTQHSEEEVNALQVEEANELLEMETSHELRTMGPTIREDLRWDAMARRNDSQGYNKLGAEKPNVNPKIGSVDYSRNWG